jgi:hypothetical protein
MRALAEQIVASERGQSQPPSPQSQPNQADADIEAILNEALGPDTGDDAPPEGSGISQQEWDVMPPEDRALFQ